MMLGNVILNATVQEGQIEKRDVSTLKEVRLNIGNATNVEVKLNGQVVAYPLDPEKELHQRLVIKKPRDRATCTITVIASMTFFR